MSKPVIVAIAVGSVGVIALLISLVLNESQGSIRARARGPAPLTEPTASEPVPSVSVPDTPEVKLPPTPRTTVVARPALPVAVEPNGDKPLDEEPSLLTQLHNLAASDPPPSPKATSTVASELVMGQ